MIQRCGVDYNRDKVSVCGKVFDDAERMTLCPHPRLNDPRWRYEIELWDALVANHPIYDWIIISTHSSLIGKHGPYVIANEGLGDEVSQTYRWWDGTVENTIVTVWSRGHKTEYEANQALKGLISQCA